jgi:EmrB/QacA subfamily drug resistance transporter
VTSKTEKKIPDRMLLGLVAIGFFMQMLDSTIVNTALPSMARSLGESPLRMQSVVIAYALTMAMLIPASGWIADRFGTRRAFFSAITLFVIGSVLCAMSRTLTQLVASRVVQGAGGAMLLPVGRLAVLRAFPHQQFLRAMSVVAIPGMIGPLIGPTLGGWLAEQASWHWIFLINVPIGFIGAFATLRYMPDDRNPRHSRLDLAGYLLIASGMAALSIALDGIGELGLGRALVLVLLVFGLASLVAYWLHAARVPNPLFSTQLFAVRTYTIGLLGNLFSRIGSSSMPFLLPLLFQVSLHYSPMEAGFTMIPVALAAVGTKRVVSPLLSRLGYRKVLVGNTVIVGMAIASFSLLSASQPHWLRVIQLLCLGAANSLQFTAMNTVALKDLNRTQASSGNGLLSVVQMLAMSFGVAASAALLATFTDMFGTDTPAHSLRAFHATFLCVGLMTCASAWVFWQLDDDIRSTDTEEAPVEVG